MFFSGRCHQLVTVAEGLLSLGLVQRFASYSVRWHKLKVSCRILAVLLSVHTLKRTGHRYDVTIWRMGYAYWKTKAINTHTPNMPYLLIFHENNGCKIAAH